MFERQAAGRYGSFVEVPAGNEPLILRCIGRNPEPLKDFLRHCKEVTKQSEESKTAIFSRGDDRYNEGMMWIGPQLVLNRPLDTIELDDYVKTSLIQDVEDYLKPKTREYYAINGIPYRRGYLFHGAPGTGKSSFCRALAGHFRLELYMLSLASNSIDETTLIRLFEALPTKCLVLLEDIDTAGIVREEAKGAVKATEVLQADRASVAPAPPPPGMYWPTPRPAKPVKFRGPGSFEHVSFMETKSVITLSTLLNVIDGTAAKEGRILVMTTNSPESLDKALIRPGRIDKQVLFPPMSCRSAARIFTRMLSIGRNHDDVVELAEQFAAKMPDGQITPAEVQGFLLDHRNDPEGAVKDVAKWSTALLEAKELGKNVIELSDSDEGIAED
jgi:chaperone BCS1